MNVVCFELSVMNGLFSASLLWMVCYERVCFEWEPIVYIQFNDT